MGCLSLFTYLALFGPTLLLNCDKLLCAEVESQPRFGMTAERRPKTEESPVMGQELSEQVHPKTL